MLIIIMHNFFKVQKTDLPFSTMYKTSEMGLNDTRTIIKHEMLYLYNYKITEPRRIHIFLDFFIIQKQKSPLCDCI
jgi:hypothetical protein